jgi:hypothetical protein
VADAYVQLPDDSANTGKKEDHYTIANGNYREAVVIGDPSVVAGVAPVSATIGLGVNLLDGSDVTQGAEADAAVVGDNSGTVSAKLRGLSKILADVWSVANHWLQVSIQNATLAVTQSGSWVLAAGTALIGQVSSSLETSTIYNGTTALTPAYAVIALSASGNVVGATAGKSVRVLAYNFIANGTVNVKFQTDQAGSPVDLTGLKYCVANMGICAPFNPVGWFQGESGKTLDLSLSASVAIGGEVVYINV